LSTKRYPSHTLKQVLLRIPEPMRDALERAADENGRSLTAEVLARIESTFPADEVWLSRVQKSPRIQKGKKLIALQVAIEAVQSELDTLKKSIEALDE